MSSVIAIVGRPNVGKSTLFNILTGSRSAIVADFSGLTRDRKYGNVKDSSLVLIDTGGISMEDSDMSEAIKKQTESAIEEANTIFFIVSFFAGQQAASFVLIFYSFGVHTIYITGHFNYTFMITTVKSIYY